MKQIYDYLVSLAMLVLMLAGLAGVAVYAFRDSGWVSSWIRAVWSFETGHPAVAIPLTAAAALVLRACYRHQLGDGRTGKLPTVLVYALMATGALFIGAFAWQHVI